MQKHERITDTMAFWTSHQEDYLAQARKIALVTARTLRPLEGDPQRWEERVMMIVRGITASVTPELFTLHLPSLGKKQQGMVVVTRALLREWVEAGQRGEQGAKRITPDDAALLAKGDAGMKKLLSRLGNACYSHSMDYNRLRTAINEWAGNEASGGGEGTAAVTSKGGIPTAIITAIHQAWHMWFRSIIPMDHAQWLKKEFARR